MEAVAGSIEMRLARFQRRQLSILNTTVRLGHTISEEGHILKSSREGNVPVGFVWSIVDIEREYPPGGGDEFESGGSNLDFEVSGMKVLGQFKFMLSGPGGYLSLSLDGGNIVSQQMIPVSNETVFNGFAMLDGFRGVAVGDGGLYSGRRTQDRRSSSDSR